MLCIFWLVCRATQSRVVIVHHHKRETAAASSLQEHAPELKIAEGSKTDGTNLEMKASKMGGCKSFFYSQKRLTVSYVNDH